MRRQIFIFGAVLSILAVFIGCQNGFSGSSGGKTAWLDELDLSKAQTETAKITVNKSIDGNSLTINGQKYERGLGTNTPVKITLALDGKASRFTALTGADDEARTTPPPTTTGRGGGRGRGGQRGTVQFVVVGDNKVLFKSSVKRPGAEPNQIDLNISGVKEMQLIAADVDSPAGDHADWAMAQIEYGGKAPSVIESKSLVTGKYILTPKPGPKPKITGPKVFGVRPGNPFLFTATATGERPMSFGAKGLPAGLTINSSNGQITGTVKQRGEYKVTLIARNNLGMAEREFRIVVGDTIALTPPMGWNSWNCWGRAVDEEKVRASAKAMYDSGLINHGWSYMNIDDVWMRAPANSQRNRNDPNLAPPPRDTEGNILPNGRFPDMKGLCDYIHGLGLKVGIYSGPGPTTCQGLEASWQHELQDAQQYAKWGIDYLKYDWCGYSSVSGQRELEDLQRPYFYMRKCLDQVPRDIVYSLCQYGWGKVWEWGEQAGGNCWRTTGDITDSWSSMARGFNEAPHCAVCKAGTLERPGYDGSRQGRLEFKPA